jgi:hypothetical protein
MKYGSVAEVQGTRRQGKNLPKVTFVPILIPLTALVLCPNLLLPFFFELFEVGAVSVVELLSEFGWVSFPQIE